MSEALISAVAQSVESDGSAADSPFTVDAGVFDQFDARLEELFWWEGPENALYVAESRTMPEVAVRIALDGSELDVEVLESPTFGRNYRVISSPGEDTSPQFD